MGDFDRYAIDSSNPVSWKYLLNSFLASNNFCCLLKTLSNSLHLDLNSLTLIVFLEDFFSNVNFVKSQQTTTKA